MLHCVTTYLKETLNSKIEEARINMRSEKEKHVTIQIQVKDSLEEKERSPECDN